MYINKVKFVKTEYGNNGMQECFFQTTEKFIVLNERNTAKLHLIRLKRVKHNFSLLPFDSALSGF